MESYERRLSSARCIYNAGLRRVSEKPEPKGQKFPCGTRVRIDENLGRAMSHFESGVEATVLYTYAHAYGGSNIESYCLDVDGHGEISWYYEHQLSKA